MNLWRHVIIRCADGRELPAQIVGFDRTHQTLTLEVLCADAFKKVQS